VDRPRDGSGRCAIGDDFREWVSPAAKRAVRRSRGFTDSGYDGPSGAHDAASGHEQPVRCAGLREVAPGLLDHADADAT
jgi:hypothetical protein